jgi:hypothetical protein
MEEYITVQSCTIAYLIWLGCCIYISHKTKFSDESVTDVSLNGLGYSFSIPFFIFIVFSVLWFLFNVVIGNFN